MPSVVVFQEFTTNEFAKELPLTLVPINPVIEDIPSATPADQGVLQTTSTSQRQEIALKQASQLI
jgi:hypothetical protein